jgi:hypothetical protein
MICHTSRGSSRPPAAARRAWSRHSVGGVVRAEAEPARALCGGVAPTFSARVSASCRVRRRPRAVRTRPRQIRHCAPAPPDAYAASTNGGARTHRRSPCERRRRGAIPTARGSEGRRGHLIVDEAGHVELAERLALDLPRRHGKTGGWHPCPCGAACSKWNAQGLFVSPQGCQPARAICHHGEEAAARLLVAQRAPFGPRRADFVPLAQTQGVGARDVKTDPARRQGRRGRRAPRRRSGRSTVRAASGRRTPARTPALIPGVGHRRTPSESRRRPQRSHRTSPRWRSPATAPVNRRRPPRPSVPR